LSAAILFAISVNAGRPLKEVQVSDLHAGQFAHAQPGLKERSHDE
jgi:hypothetical protein